jgi:Zn-dependent M28 family amino/carboxypeptidase
VRNRISSTLGCTALALLFCLHAASADLKYKLLPQDTLIERLKAAPLKNPERARELEAMFRQAGCEPSDQAVKGLKEPNVICIQPGSTDAVIVVGGHLDKVADGTGVVDDWSGASMLPSLYQSLAGQQRAHTFVFIGFAGEEEGLVGSQFYVKQLTPEQRKRIAAMVNLECLGVTPTKVWVSRSEPMLVRMLVATAQSQKLPLSGVNVEKVGTDDAQSFGNKIPHITIHSLTQDTWPILHSDKDRFAAINKDFYYDSYRIIAGYLALLDQYVPTDGSPVDPTHSNAPK